VDLKQLNYFLTIVEHRSFRKAADVLGVSQPALSISIKQLEQSLGCLLLDRTPGHVVPTAFGLSLCESTRRIQQEVRLAQARLHEIHGITRGQITVGVSPYAFTETFAELLGEFINEYPGLELHTRVEIYESSVPLLASGQIDMAIVEVIDRPRPAHLAYAVLYRNPFVIVARPGHPLTKRRRLHPADLMNYPWIYGTDMVNHVNNWRTTFEDAGMSPPTPVVSGGGLRFHEKLLASGDFLAVLPLTHIKDSIAADKVVELGFPGIEWFNYMDILYREDISMSPGAKRLFDEVLIRMGKDGTPTRRSRSGKKKNTRR
jgi:DNA-binding transcriptional LysR family regulator